MRRLLVLLLVSVVAVVAAATTTAAPPPASPDMTPSPTKVSFPRTVVGYYTSSATITINNNSSYTWYSFSASVSTGTNLSLDWSTCGSSAGIAPGGSCTLGFQISRSVKGHIVGTLDVTWQRPTALGTALTHSYVAYSGGFYQPHGTF